MTQFLTSILWTVSLLTCVYIYRSWSAYTKFHTAATQHGCQKPRKYPHREPFWGYDLYRARTRAAQRGQLMKLYEEHFNSYGKTFVEQFFNTKIINTMEAANIQQTAALSFYDFGKVAGRNRSTSPFLGRGIFTEDGALWKHSRELIKPTFSRSEISDLDSLGIFVDRLFELIPPDGSTFDIQPLLHKLVLRPCHEPSASSTDRIGSFSIYQQISYSAHP